MTEKREIPMFIYTLPIWSMVLSIVGLFMFAIGVETTAFVPTSVGAFMFVVFIAVASVAESAKRLAIAALKEETDD